MFIFAGVAGETDRQRLYEIIYLHLCLLYLYVIGVNEFTEIL